MMQAKDDQVWTLYYCRLIGYIFLILTFFDLVETFYPPSIRDPNWLIQVMGILIERSFAPLIGLVLVFWGAAEFRGVWERPLVKLISWFTLLVSLFYMLLIPLGISSGLRIDKQNSGQATAQYRQGAAQLNEIKNQVNVASEKDLRGVLENLKQQKQFQINSVDELRTKLPEQVDQAIDRLAAQTVALQKQQRQKLVKSLVKWCVGALVIATAFLLSWRSTKWARKL